MKTKQILTILSLLCLPLVAAPKMPVRGLCAHRGDSAAFPENTVPAIEASAKKGAAMVEIDVKRCKTGELVLMHDSSVDRTTTGTGIISNLTFEAIRSFDAGVKKDPKFAGTKVPTFDEAIDCLPKEGIWVNYCFANTEEDAKKIYALGLDFALTDNLDAVLPFFPTRFADEK